MYVIIVTIYANTYGSVFTTILQNVLSVVLYI